MSWKLTEPSTGNLPPPFPCKNEQAVIHGFQLHITSCSDQTGACTSDLLYLQTLKFAGKKNNIGDKWWEAASESYIVLYNYAKFVGVNNF